MPYYRVDSRQQDEGWLPDMVDGRERMFPNLDWAIRYAERESRNFLYGMARVVDIAQNRVICEFSCGHHQYGERELEAHLRSHGVAVNAWRLRDLTSHAAPVLPDQVIHTPISQAVAQPRFVEVDTDIRSVATEPGERNLRHIRIRKKSEE